MLPNRLTAVVFGLLATLAPQNTFAQLKPAEATVWHQGPPGVKGAVEAGDYFGFALATADFNRDGQADLAIGVPFEAIGGAASAGAVSVFHGDSAGQLGVDDPEDQLWTQGTPGMPGVSETNDRWGLSFATGDFNRDGYGDLAIGAPFEGVGPINRAGAVTVLYGGHLGLSVAGVQLLTQDSVDSDGDPVPYSPLVDDLFGRALSAGDFNGDGYADLAVGIPGQEIPFNAVLENPGAVQIFYGSKAGLGIEPGAELEGFIDGTGFGFGGGDQDHFGEVLAAADFDGDGSDELVVGVPSRDNGATPDVGAALVFRGGEVGITSVGLKTFLLGNEEGAAVGSALAAADFDNDGRPDLAVGAAFADVFVGVTNAGAVHFLYGSATGLEAPGLNRTDMVANPLLRFVGLALTAGDFNHDGLNDLVAGAEVPSAPSEAGALAVFYGSDHKGLLGVLGPPQVLRQGKDGLPGATVAGNLFGNSLAVADFTGDGVDDLVAGAPGNTVGGQPAAGTITIIPGSVLPPTCLPDTTHLCLAGDRFRVSVNWKTDQGTSGQARVVPGHSLDSGLFWFFNDDNWEMLVKVLNGCAINQHFWVFAAATTNVGYTLTVEDTQQNESRQYINPLGTPAQAQADVDALDTCTAEDARETPDLETQLTSLHEWAATVRVFGGAPAARAEHRDTVRAPVVAAADTCAPSATRLCLNDSRFKVTVQWRTEKEDTGSGMVVPFGSKDSGLFWFFNDDNWEMLVKVLNGCAINQHFWVFAAATTNVEYTLTVTDTAAEQTETYFNPLNNLAASITDTGSFATCP